MPRSIEISASAEKAEQILRKTHGMEGVVGAARQRGASIQPRGDIVTLHTSNDGMRSVLAALHELDVLDGGSIVTSEPRSILSRDRQDAVDDESNETVWDEMAFLLRQDTNLATNYLSLMALAGAIAAVGLWADTLHVVIGAMVIAPAFEPLVRVPFGLIAGPRRISRTGLLSIAAGYGALMAGGLLALIVLEVVDPSRTTDLQNRSWIRFWSTVTPTGVVASAFAAMAGAFVISGQRSVLTTGVMVALALIPSMAIVGMALGVGDLPLAGRGLIRWAVDAGLVVALSGLVLGAKRILLQRHRALS